MLSEEKHDELSSHELSEQKKREKEEIRDTALKLNSRKKLTKKIINWGIVAIIVLGIVFLFYRAATISSNFESYTDGPVHWHADFNVFLCGNRVDFSSLGSAGSMAGPMLLHTHGDHKIHIEGLVSRAGDIAVGNFFRGIGHRFSSSGFDDYTNENDKCGGDNKIVMLVNGEENPEFENYVLKDGDVIEVRYE